MDLARMTYPELLRLIEALELIRQGAQMLAGLPVDDGGEQLSISLQPGRLASITTSFRMPNAADFEAPKAESNRIKAVIEAMELPPASAWQIEPPATVIEDAPADPVALPFKIGPYSDAEKETVRRMASEGASDDAIAQELGRHPSTIPLARARISRATEAEARPVTSIAPAPPSPVVPRLPARQLEIKVALDRVKRRKGFDPELDLEIVEGYTRNQDKVELALVLGIDGHEMRERYRDLISVCTDRKGEISAEDIQHLLRELRRRAALGRVKVSPAL